jgi:CHASE3 domain sensor protein
MTRSSLGVAAAAALCVCCAVILVAANFANSRAAATTAREVDASWDAIQKSEETLSLLRDAEIGQRGYLLVGRRSYLQPYSNAVDRVIPAIQQLQVRVQNDSIQETRARTLETLAGQKMAELRVTIDMMDAGNPTALSRPWTPISARAGWTRSERPSRRFRGTSGPSSRSARPGRRGHRIACS